MKPITLTLILLFALFSCRAQEKLSAVENFVQLEAYAGTIPKYSLEYNDIQYAVYYDLGDLVLINLDDRNAPPKRYELGVDCFDMDLSFRYHARIGNRIYFVHLSSLYTIDLDTPEWSHKKEIDSAFSSYYLRIIEGDHILSYSYRSDTLRLLLIDPLSYTAEHMELPDYRGVKTTRNELLLLSTDSKTIAKFDFQTKGVTEIYNGTIIDPFYGFFTDNSDFVFRDDNSSFLLRYKQSSGTLENFCIQGVNFNLDYVAGVNLPDHILITGYDPNTLQYVMELKDKEECSSILSIDDLESGINFIFQTEVNQQNILTIIGNDFILNYNIATGEFRRYAVNTGSLNPPIIQDSKLIFWEYFSIFNSRNITIIDLITGDRTTQAYELDANNLQFIAYSQDSITVLMEAASVLSVGNFSTNNDEYSIRSVTSPSNIGLKGNNTWVKAGTSISSRDGNVIKDHLFLYDDTLVANTPLELAKGYYLWGDNFSGVTAIDGKSYFVRYNSTINEIEEQHYLSNQPPFDKHPIVRLDERYYEVKAGRFQRISPLDPSFPISGATNFESTPLLQLEKSFFALKQIEDGTYSIRKFANGEETIIKSGLQSKYYKTITLWKRDGATNIYMFYQAETDETFLLSIDSQTGDVLHSGLYPGSVIDGNKEARIKKWTAIKFQTVDETAHIVQTDGQAFEQYDLPDELIQHYQDARCFIVNDNLFVSGTSNKIFVSDQMSSLIEINDLTTHTEQIQDIIFRNNRYFVIISGFLINRIVTLSDDFTFPEEIFNQSKASCNDNQNAFIGHIDTDNILVSLSNISMGNELWKVNTLSSSVELYHDFNGIEPSGFISVEFISDGYVYFKAKDEDQDIQLYRIELYEEGLSVEESVHSHTSISLYPNPSHSSITFSEPLTYVTITALDGKIIWKQPNTSQLQSVNIEDIATGLYILTGRTIENTFTTIKFVKI